MNRNVRRHRCALVTACMRPDGTPALALTEVEVSDEERAEGLHYLRAEAQLAAQGYEEPMVHFDDREAPPFLLAAVRRHRARSPQLARPVIVPFPRAPEGPPCA